ncbi:ATP-binding protein [Psychromonas antarctica]|uniref:ATP-binding protein n=1 Tax=Psychromonas antarctica TaxID=67573 RepID=UPI001EE884B4|nr:ATP-binding protein [Psychromonas antarctica]MCG6200863.1 ATP-binding protein [Psychromonas antarctica]
MKFSDALLVKSGSIKYFLLIVITLLFTFYLVAVYLISAHRAKHEIDEIFDAQLAHSAFILFNVLGENVSLIDQTNLHLPIVYHGFEVDKRAVRDAVRQNKIAYQVFNQQGKLLIKSSSAPDVAFSDKKKGYSSLQIKGRLWRVYTLYDEDLDFWLYVAESGAIRNELSEGISVKIIMLPALVIFPIFLLLLAAIIRFGLAPLEQLVSSINRREAYSLKTIDLNIIPKELSPVLNAINALITRLDDALTREQRLTADTAHELRTPLSVVLIHAQNALNSDNEVDRDIALRELDSGVKRVARLLEQLLTLSKITPETLPQKALIFHQLCQNILAEMAVKIINKNQELVLCCEKEDQGICLLGSEFLLEILIRNLIDNASQYTPDKGVIKLTIKRAGQQMLLVVEDSGIGIDPALYIRLTERFYRQHQQQSKGAGLGLTLVNTIVEFHQGELSFAKSPLGGLQVTIRMPIC